MIFKFIIKNEYGAAIVEYAIIISVFLGIFVFFGNKLFENSVRRANETQGTIAKVVPCSELGSSKYLLGSKLEDRDICID